MSRHFGILVCAIVLGGCGDLCDNDIVQRVVAPNGRLDAVIFQRDCGATTEFSTQISVLPSGREPTDGGNLFIADTDHGKAAAESWGGPWAEVQWIANDQLLIRYDKRSRTFATNSIVGKTVASYAQVDG